MPIACWLLVQFILLSILYLTQVNSNKCYSHLSSSNFHSGSIIGGQSMFIDNKFKSNWKSYVIQSSFAALSVFIIILILKMEHAVVIASIGATAFIVFAMPNNITAKPKKIIGGHLVGLITGSFFAI